MNETLFKYNLSLKEKQFISNKMVSIWTFNSLLFQQLSIALVRNQVGNNLKV